MKHPDEQKDARLAAAANLADGEPIDWSAASRDAHSEADRDFFERLQAIAEIAKAHAKTTGDLLESVRGDQESIEGNTQDPITWGPLRILEKIGRGSFGDVYRAWDPRLDRAVALKLLRHRDPSDENVVIEEARLMARVRHPHVVTIYGAERIDGRTGIWMELLAGPTLKDEVLEHGPMSPAETMRIGADLCDALDAVHRAGLLHGDIKAQNVVRAADGRLVVTDFGTGRDLLCEEATQNTSPAGTPLYLAPELLAGGAATVRADVYSLGVLLWYVASGEYPVVGTSLEEIRTKHAAGERRLMRDTSPRHLAAVLLRATDGNPDNRFSGARELKAALLSSTRQPARSVAVLAATAIAITALVFSVRAPHTGGSRGFSFESNDYVLLTEFENRSGDQALNGALEYAMQRELASSRVVNVVPSIRVEDTLRLMRQPADTRLTRAVGREVCVRDGEIRAMVTGRLERLGQTYVLTTQVIDPATDRAIATERTDFTHQGQILNAVRRHAEGVRRSLGEKVSATVVPTLKVEPASTRSLNAYQLYSRSYELGRVRQWSAALELARRVVVEDPDFASGWIWLAWSLRNDPAKHSPDEIRSAADRAVQLVGGLPEWERLWILSSRHSVLNEDKESIPYLQALMRLRPDHYYGANNLMFALSRLQRQREKLDAAVMIANQRPTDLVAHYRAASEMVESGQGFAAASPYVERMKRLLDAGVPVRIGESVAIAWFEVLPVYVAWQQRDVTKALELTDRVALSLNGLPDLQRDALAWAIGYAYVSLGRLQDAASTFALRTQPLFRLENQWQLALLRGDQVSAQRLARLIMDEERNAGRSPIGRFRPSMLLRSGLTELARDVARQSGGAPTGAFAVGRGQLALRDGRIEEGIQQLTEGLSLLTPTPNIGEYHQGCEALATAYIRAAKREQAMATLRACVAAEPKFLATGYLGVAPWLHARLRLADEYRQSGNIEGARALETDLRQLLAVADADHPLLLRLKQRN